MQQNRQRPGSRLQRYGKADSHYAFHSGRAGKVGIVDLSKILLICISLMNCQAYGLDIGKGTEQSIDAKSRALLLWHRLAKQACSEVKQRQLVRAERTWQIAADTAQKVEPNGALVVTSLSELIDLKIELNRTNELGSLLDRQESLEKQFGDKFPGLAAVYYHRGCLMAGEEKWSEAAHWLEVAASIQPAYSSECGTSIFLIWRSLAPIYLIQGKDELYVRMKDRYLKELKVKRSSTRRTGRLRAFADGLITDADRLFSVQPGSPERQALRRKLYKAAIPLYQQVLTLDPDASSYLQCIIEDCLCQALVVTGGDPHLERRLEYASKLYLTKPGLSERERAEGIASIANYYISLRKQDAALALYAKALPVYERQESADSTASLLSSMACAYQSLHKYELAIEMCKRSLALQVKEQVKGTTMVLADCYHSLHRYDLALSEWSRVLAFGGIDTNTLGNILNSMADSCVHLQRYQRAIALYERSLSVWQSLNNEEVSESILAAIAVCHSYLENYRLAIQFMERALTICEKRGGSVAGYLSSIAYWHDQLGDHRKAEQIHKQALSKMETGRESTRLRSSVLLNLGSCYRSQNQHAQAVSCFEKALNLWQSVSFSKNEEREHKATEERIKVLLARARQMARTSHLPGVLAR